MAKSTLQGWDSLHPTQQKLYELLLAQKDASDSLTLDEMRNELGVSSLNTVVHHMKQLEKKGYIRRRGGLSGIEVLPAPVRDIVYLNLYATVGCSPTGFFNDDNIIEKIPFPAKRLRFNSESFLVEARGDSMEPLIHDRDLVLVDRSPVSSGDTAVVVHRGEAKLKRFFKERGRAVLQSLNPKYDPVVADPNDITPVGVVRGVVRSFPISEVSVEKTRPQRASHKK